MEIKSPNGLVYSGLKLIGETEEFRVYDCDPVDGCSRLVKVAATLELNGLLDREAYLLKCMKDESVKLEDEHVRRGMDGRFVLNYHFAFPILTESFLDESQGGRRINVLSFSHICNKIEELVPLGHIASRDHLYVDPKTSGWIMGKLLKILVFAHSMGIALGVKINGDNILINREQHYVTFFDWSGLVSSDTSVSGQYAMEDIADVAREVIAALGGDIDSEQLPPSDQLDGNSYAEFIFSLARGEMDSAKRAHTKFYELVCAIWPRGFHPFTASAVKS